MRTRPAAVLAVHGAGSSPAVFDGWDRHFAVPFVTVDLQAGLDVARAGMAEYAEGVVRAASAHPQPVALVGWSMGGLVVMQAARRLDADGRAPTGLVLVEPSPPGQVAGFRPDVDPTDGVFDPEEVYGDFPPDQPARPESARARGERRRGVSVPSLPCPALVIAGREFPDDRGRVLAFRYRATHRSYPALSHWQLVRDPGVAAATADFLGGTDDGPGPRGPARA
jgi:pimeloyl-ACP methyl ester carboxylesterase